MTRVLQDLAPNKVFQYFEEISQIPRGSGNEKAISDYLLNFANKHSLEVFRDEFLNVTIKKPASSGYENSPTIIIQGHMDMVNEKNKETVHDFDKDPLKLRVVDDMIYATNTTLGADNGIAIAYALAILESNEILHPSLEVLLTADEESSMSGALNLKASHLKGRMLVNIDSEEDGKLLVSSAGGTKARMALPINWESAPKGFTSYKISIGGLKGGHSGMEINKGRGNANKLMGRLLNSINSSFEMYISEINGGLKSNAITRECEVTVLVKPTDIEQIKSNLKKWQKVFENELRVTDSEVSIKLEMVQKDFSKVFTKCTTDKLIATIVIIPNGVQSMSMEIEGLVQSSINLGVIKTEENEIYLVSEIRSCVRSLKHGIRAKVEMIAKTFGGEVHIDSDYPEWEYNPNSMLRQQFVKVYKEKYNKDPEIIAIHAGLECGILSQKLEGLDSISLGPNIYDVHTPDEHISISSTKNVWEFFLDVLKSMKDM